ncbi:unnamed protein product [Schistosoma mattheei]|uniref:Uncharacterized protein n=1 Tax=Schistosoma mattheei TaxID=31246 RepID=A0A183NPL8_9TREM|nr:unnamed protein product [Schistosoma mattheei]
MEISVGGVSNVRDCVQSVLSNEMESEILSENLTTYVDRYLKHTVGTHVSVVSITKQIHLIDDCINKRMHPSSFKCLTLRNPC